MNAPEINIRFIERATSTLDRADRGIVALLVVDAVIASLSNPFTVVTASDIPKELSDATKDQIKLALEGYEVEGEKKAPTKVIVYCMGQQEQANEDTLNEKAVAEILAMATAAGYEMKSTEQTTQQEVIKEYLEQQTAANEVIFKDVLAAFETITFSYMAIPNVETSGQKDTVKEWIKKQRAAGTKVKVVLPNCEADDEGIINYPIAKTVRAETTTSNGEEVTTEIEYTAEQFCARIAGLLAATPSNYSATYAVLSDVVACEKIVDRNAAVDAGQFIIFHDGEKIKTCRAVNSFQTTTDEKGEAFKKIRVVEIMDIISNDIRRTAEDEYLGKYPNTYDNKCILITAINEYLNELQRDNMIGAHSVEIDMEAQREYLKSKGKDISEMTDDEIKKAPTGSKVFLKGTMEIIDAIEDLNWNIYI